MFMVYFKFENFEEVLISREDIIVQVEEEDVLKELIIFVKECGLFKLEEVIWMQLE